MTNIEDHSLTLLVMEFPEDANCRELPDQFMIGEFLLAAPVMTPGVSARAVYLPKGIWYDYYTGKKYRGGQYILADAPLDTLPLFANNVPHQIADYDY